MEELIVVDNVSKVFNPGMPDEMHALRSVSLTVRRGAVAVLRGPSGSGKTSLLSIIGCMTRPTSGRVMIEGRDVAKLPERYLSDVRRRTFGFIFQQFNLIRDLDVEENVLLPLYPSGASFARMRERSDALLDRFGLLAKRKVKIKRLSGGEQQRVAISRSLINDPAIVIADEPTAHLDRALATELAATLASLHRDGKTLIIATHDPFLAEQDFVTDVVEMKDSAVLSASRR